MRWDTGCLLAKKKAIVTTVLELLQFWILRPTASKKRENHTYCLILGMLFLFRRIFLDKLLNHKVWMNQTASPLKQLWGRCLHSPFSLHCFQMLGTGVAGPTVHWALEQGFPLSCSPQSCPGYHLPLGLDHLFLWKLQNSVYKNPNCFFWFIWSNPES